MAKIVLKCIQAPFFLGIPGIPGIPGIFEISVWNSNMPLWSNIMLPAVIGEKRIWNFSCRIGRFRYMEYMATKRSVLTSASEDRLEKLIEERLKPGANKDLIDKRIWNLFGEERCIMFTDLSGFSRNVAKFGIIHFLQTIFESQRVLIPVIDEHGGILLKTEGDSFLVIFRNALKGLKCAVQANEAFRVEYAF